jgi:phosphonate transport system substrate-binding protein
VTRYHLATLGEPSGFFGRVLEVGSHIKSLEMVVAGTLDAAAIDSTVLEKELASRPELRDQIRVVDSLGPSPIPPWVASTTLAPADRASIREHLLGMHLHVDGHAILARGEMLRFVKVRDSDYDPIRHMAQISATVRW